MSGQRFGRAYISIDGSLLPTMPGAKLDLGGEERTAVTGDNTVLGFTAQVKPATLTCEISLGAGDSIETLRRATDVTLTFECDTGQTYVVRQAFATKTLELSAGDSGKVAMEFQGMPAQEMGA